MKKTINAYSLSEFVEKIQTEVKSGWEIDFEDNDSIPHGGMGFYRCMVGRGEGKQIPALFLAPHIPDGSEDPLITSEGLSEHREPFTPSVVFTVDESTSASSRSINGNGELPRKSGRPKSGTI